MNRVQVFEPALCCATGVCGEDVDQELVTFSADLDFVRSQGGDVSRYNLASEPLAFAETEAVRGFLRVAGSKGLPLVLVDGVTALTGGYPDRAQLAEWAGVAAPLGAAAVRTPAGARMLGLKAATSTAGASSATSTAGASSATAAETQGCCTSPASSETESCCSSSTSSPGSEAGSCCSKPAGSQNAGCC